jgi:5-methylcytosine-specific restriction protein A
MPTAPARICRCGRTVPAGVRCECVRARRAAADALRPSAAARGYDADWRDLRARFLAVHLKCCTPGCDRHATDVDHIVSVRDRPDLRLDWSNLRPMCHAHHSARTAREQGFARPGRTDQGGRVEVGAEGAGTVRGPSRDIGPKSSRFHRGFA